MHCLGATSNKWQEKALNPNFIIVELDIFYSLLCLRREPRSLSGSSVCHGLLTVLWYPTAPSARLPISLYPLGCILIVQCLSLAGVKDFHNHQGPSIVRFVTSNLLLVIVIVLKFQMTCYLEASALSRLSLWYCHSHSFTLSGRTRGRVMGLHVFHLTSACFPSVTAHNVLLYEHYPS